MASKFALKKTGKGKFMFNLKAANGQVILTSQLYADKHGALKGIQSARKNAPKDSNFERRTAGTGEPYFVLMAANKEIIGRSEMYASAGNVEKGIASVRKNAPSAALEDQTG
ncbi:MAG TPA: YegP family protein [Anaerolineales bacterium]|jgi:hypothetical protein|nr:YegP family protein [Anaerolineales bacterium]